MSITESVRKMSTDEMMCYEMGYRQGRHDAVKHGFWKEEIESLQAQLEQKTNEAEGMRSNWYKCIENLKESQRRADAAGEDLERYGRNIHTCDKATACTIAGQDHAACYDCPDWIWRGAQA